MSWNYRIMAHEHKGEVTLIIHEVYYDKKGKPNSYSEPPATFRGDSQQELFEVVGLMTRCFNRPILWYGDKFPEEYSPEDINKNESNPKEK